MKDRMETDEIAERASKVRVPVLRITHLIDNILNSSRLIEDGAGIYFRTAKIDLTALLCEVCELHREMAPERQFVERFDTAPLYTVGDSKLLFQVFSNLLANAVKYSPGGGPIDISANVVSEQVVVAITDHGIGISASDLDRLFERYHRGGNVSGIVGTGVGLYLVKMVIDLHGGSISVESKEGEGSCFTLRLPIKDPSQINVVSPANAASSSPESNQFVDHPVG